MTPAQRAAVDRIVAQAPPITETQVAQLRAAGLRNACRPDDRSRRAVP